MIPESGRVVGEAIKTAAGRLAYGLSPSVRPAPRIREAGLSGKHRSGVLEGKAGSGGVRWRLVLPAGIAVAVGTIILARVIIYLYIFGPMIFLFQGQESLPERAQAQQFGFLMGHYGMPALFLLLTVGAALWIGRRVGLKAPLHGVLAGVVAVVVSQAIGFRIEPQLLLWELLVYPILGVGGGLLGGMRGWAVRAGEEALYEASRDVAAARGPRAIAAAIGERLAGTDVVGVSAWEARGEGDVPEKLELLGFWSPPSALGKGAGRPWPPGSRMPLGRHLRGLFDRPVALEVGELPPAAREAWEERGARSVLFVPLLGPGGSWSGALAVASRRGGRGGFSPGVRRAYSTVGAQAAAALENISLVEEARRAGLLGERRRLAGEIHDTLAQSFTSVVTNLEAAEAALGTEGETLAAAHRHLNQARATARDGLAEARRLVWALKPALLENAALPEALSRLAVRWSEESEVYASAAVTGEALPLSPQVEAALFRAAREALTNVGKHAGASRAALTLSYVGDRVVLDVLDDGRGFDPGAPRHARTDGGGFGLEAMRERIESLGGAFTVESARGEGTSLVVELPAGGTGPK